MHVQPNDANRKCNVVLRHPKSTQAQVDDLTVSGISIALSVVVLFL